MNSSNDIVELQYPNPTDKTQGVLILHVCKFGNYLMAGRSTTASFTINYEMAQLLSTKLLDFSRRKLTTAKISDGKTTLTLDNTLFDPLYAAMVEMIVDVELGDVLS